LFVMKTAAFLALALMGLPAMAQAAEPDVGRFSLGLTAGALGVGPEVGYRLSPRIGVRGNATFLSLSHGFDSDDIAYHGKVHLKSGGAMLDVYPTGGNFRVSAGARINGNKASVSATPTGPVEVGNVIYTPAQIGRLSGKADVKNLAPALTAGWSHTTASGLVFGVEAGALFQGRIRVKSLTASGGSVALGDLQRERAQIQDDLDGYKVYPILQVSLGHAF
jgi:hypothetical protein